VEAGEGDELELVAHRAELALELGDGRVVEVALPVERRRAVVGEHLARVLLLHALGEFPREREVRGAGLAPHHVGVFGVGDTARQRLLEALLRTVEAFGGALAGEERLVVLVHVGRDDVRRFRVGPRQQHRRHAHHVGREARRDQLLHRFLRRHQHLAAHVAALLHRGELVFIVHAGGAGVDHGLHQLEGVQHAAETRLGVGDDRREPVDVALAFHGLNLIRAHQRVVDALHYRRHGGHRVERLVGIHRERIRSHRPPPASPRDRSPVRPAFTCCIAGCRSARRGSSRNGFRCQSFTHLGAVLRERVLDMAGCRGDAPRSSAVVGRVSRLSSAGSVSQSF
jgi:hypothetical protein